MEVTRFLQTEEKATGAFLTEGHADFADTKRFVHM